MPPAEVELEPTQEAVVQDDEATIGQYPFYIEKIAN